MALRDAVKEAHPEPEPGGGEMAYTAPPEEPDPDAPRPRRRASSTSSPKWSTTRAADRAARPVPRQARRQPASPSTTCSRPLDIIREPLPRRGDEPRGADRRVAHDDRRGAQRTRRASATAARAARPAGATTSPSGPGGRSGRRSGRSATSTRTIYALGGDIEQEPVPQPHPPGRVSGRFGVDAEYLVNADELSDQDGPGGEARRGRAAHGQEGDDGDRRDPLRQAGHRPDLARRRTTTSTRSRTWPSSSTT